MRIGTHVSIAGGIEKAPGNAAKVGAECFQIFSRSPHGGPVKPITPDVVKKFAAEMKKHKLDTFYIHTPYFINLSSVKNNIYYGSIAVIREELERGSKLSCKAVMTHLGSFGELGDKEGLEKVGVSVGKIMKGYKGTTQLLLEISAGSGRVVGDKFEEIAKILDHKDVKKHKVGVCFDTCHAFASGYDVRDKKSVDETLKQFGGHLDRHEHIGVGKIGLEGFKALAHHKILGKLDWILETPKDDPKDDPKNIAILKKLRKG